MSGMANVSTRARQAAGQPVGGQFATEAKGTATGVSLDAPGPDEVDEAEFDRRVDDMLRQFCEDPADLTAAEQRRVGERELMANAVRIASTWRERQKRHAFPSITEQDIAQEAVTELVQMARDGRLGHLDHPRSYLGKVIVNRGFEMRAEVSSLSRKGLMSRTKFFRIVNEKEAAVDRPLTAAERREIAEGMRAEDRAKRSGNVPASDEWWQGDSVESGSLDAVMDSGADPTLWQRTYEGDSATSLSLHRGGDSGSEADDEMLDFAEDVSQMDTRTRLAAAYPIMAKALDLPNPVPGSIPRDKMAKVRQQVADAGGVRSIARSWTTGSGGEAVDALFAPFGKDLSLTERDRIAGFFASQDQQTSDALWGSAMTCIRSPQHLRVVENAPPTDGVSR